MLACLIAGILILALICLAGMFENWVSIILVLLIPVVLVRCVDTESYKAYEAEQAAYKAAEWKRKTTPRVISTSPDGCTVYVFTTDREHYFTRCGSRVTTETTWKESCGKNCSKEKSDVIITEGNKE